MAPTFQPNGPLGQQADDLLTTQKLLRATLDSSTDKIQVFEAVRNEQGQIIDFIWILNNHAAAKTYGDVVGKSLLHLQPGVVEEGIFAAFKQVVETGLPQQYEKHYVHEQFDGWLYQSVVKLNDGVATTTTDVSERKRTEQELHEQTHFIRSITDTAPAIISITEFPSGATVFTNRDPFSTLGFDAEALVLMKREDRLKLVHPDDLQKLKDYYTQFEYLADEGEVRIQYRLRNKSGEWVWLDTRGKIFKRSDTGTVSHLLHIAQDVTAQKKAEQEIIRLKDEIAQRATDKYQSLFNSIDEGFCLIELLHDASGKAIDFRYLDVNDVYSRETGQRNPTGKLGSEVTPNNEPVWLETYAKIARTGEPLRFENYHHDTDRWYYTYASRVGEEGSNQVAIVFSDVTERKRNEQKQAYLFTLSDTLRSIADPIAVEEAVTVQALHYFNADRCYYGTITEDNGIINCDSFRSGLTSIAGTYSLKEFRLFWEAVKAGKPFVVNNVRTSDLVDDGMKPLCLQLGIQAFVNVPVIKQGKVVGIFTVAQNAPREWTGLDRQLVIETAERTWVAVEKARVEKALRENEERQTFLLNLSDVVRPLQNPVDIQYAAMKLLAERLDVERAGYYELDKDEDGFVVTARYDRSLVSLPPRGRLSSFDPSLIDLYHSGRIVTVGDTEEAQPESLREGYRRVGVRSWAVVPLVKDGHLLTAIGIQCAVARKWTAMELQILEDVGERTWAAVERAKAEEVLKKREAELARVQQIGQIGGVDIDVANHLSGNRSPEYLRLHGLPADTQSETHADWLRRLHSTLR